MRTREDFEQLWPGKWQHVTRWVRSGMIPAPKLCPRNGRKRVWDADAFSEIVEIWRQSSVSVELLDVAVALGERLTAQQAADHVARSSALIRTWALEGLISPGERAPGPVNQYGSISESSVIVPRTWSAEEVRAVARVKVQVGRWDGEERYVSVSPALNGIYDPPCGVEKTML